MMSTSNIVLTNVIRAMLPKEASTPAYAYIINTLNPEDGKVAGAAQLQLGKIAMFVLTMYCNIAIQSFVYINGSNTMLMMIEGHRAHLAALPAPGSRPDLHSASKPHVL